MREQNKVMAIVSKENIYLFNWLLLIKAPARFGAQAMGGVINVVTKSPGEAKSLLSLGVGSYGRFKGGFSHAGKWGGGHFLAAVHYETSEGDYTYFNDNGTPYTPDNDYELKEGTQVPPPWTPSYG